MPSDAVLGAVVAFPHCIRIRRILLVYLQVLFSCWFPAVISIDLSKCAHVGTGQELLIFDADHLTELPCFGASCISIPYAAGIGYV